MNRAALIIATLFLAVGPALAQGVVNRQIQMNQLIQRQQVELLQRLKQRLLDQQKQDPLCDRPPWRGNVPYRLQVNLSTNACLLVRLCDGGCSFQFGLTSTRLLPHLPHTG
jgi:hypothetical protein